MPKLLNKVNLPRYSSAPSTPSEADLYYNTSDDKIYVYTGAAWVEVGSGAGGSGVFYQSSEPSSPSDGDIWIDSDDEVASVTSITDSTSTTSSTVAASATAVKSAYDLANAAIAKSIVDAKGDLIVATAADTVSRLAVGATAGHVLTVDSAEATGMKWAAAAAGGMTLIATATPSAATSVSFSSIPTTYKNLVVRWFGVYMSTNAGFFAVRVNSNSGSNYSSLQTRTEGNAFNWTWTTNGTWYGKDDASNSVLPRATTSGSQFPKQGYGELTIYDYASTALSLRHMQSLSYGYYAALDVPIVVHTVGGYTASGTAITSIQFERQQGSETIDGTFYLYGVS